jgi:membrane protein implicated in regulation of membrane protease activity
MPAALIWLLLGLALLALELLGADFEGLLAAASVLSGMLPLPPLLQVGIAVALTAGLLLGLQRWGRQGRELPPVSSGERATVISGFNRGPEGRVLWQGQSWAATNLNDAQTLEAGRQVTVLGRDGTRLQVLPASGPEG